jgi:hypothetical protein
VARGGDQGLGSAANRAQNHPLPQPRHAV